MKRLALILFIFCHGAGSAEDSAWVEIATTSTETVIFARKDDINNGRSNQTDAVVWVKQDHSRDKTTDVRESKMLLRVNCVARTYKNITASAFDPNGKVILSKTPSYPKTEFIVPGTIIDELSGYLCSDPD